MFLLHFLLINLEEKESIYISSLLEFSLSAYINKYTERKSMSKLLDKTPFVLKYEFQ